MEDMLALSGFLPLVIFGIPEVQIYPDNLAEAHLSTSQFDFSLRPMHAKSLWNPLAKLSRFGEKKETSCSKVADPLTVHRSPSGTC